MIVLPMVAHEGITIQVLNQIKALEKNSYKVFLVVLSQFDQKIFDSFHLKLALDRILFAGQADSYLSVRSLLTSLSVTYRIRRFVQQNKINIVIAHAAYAHFLMRLVKSTLRSEVRKLRLYQYFHITQYKQFPVNTFKRYIINKVNKLLAKRYDNAHLFVSEAVKRDVEINLIKHSYQQVIYNALPLHVLEQGSTLRASSQDFVSLLKRRKAVYNILLPGRLENYKGQIFFINAFAAFVKKEGLLPKHIRLFILGEGSQKVQIKQLIKEFKLDDYIYVKEPIENSLFLKVLPYFNLVTLPSEFEGLPLVILEALQAKRVVLCSDIGGTNEVVRDGETGFLFKALDFSECVRKLSFIYKNRDAKLINEVAIEEELQSKFSFNKHIHKLLSVLEDDR
ncbi:MULTISPECIES: glycosyltransferase family 4 protein [Pontibacter]|nr:MULTISPECIES: glycosyltransferase family 4 protein [Pontibacter]